MRRVACSLAHSQPRFLPSAHALRVQPPHPHLTLHRRMLSSAPAQRLSLLSTKQLLTMVHSKELGTDPAQMAKAFATISKSCAADEDYRDEIFRDPRLLSLVDQIKASDLSALTPVQLTNLASGFAVFGIKDGPFMEAWTGAVVAKASDLTPVDIAASLLCLARLEYRSKDTLTALAQQIIVRGNDFMVNDIVASLNSLAVFGHKNARSLEALERVTIAKVHLMSPPQISQSLIAFAAFEHRSAPLIKAFAGAVTRASPELTPAELVRTLNGLTYFICKDEKMLAAICARACEKVDEFSAPMIVNLLSALSRLKYKQGQTLEYFHGRCVATSSDLQPGSTALLLVALAQLVDENTFRPTLLLNRLAKLAGDQASAMESQDILSTMTAMASLELRQEDAIFALGSVAKTRTRDYSFTEGKRILEVLQYLSSPPPAPGEVPKFKFHYDENDTEEGAPTATVLKSN